MTGATRPDIPAVPTVARYHRKQETVEALHWDGYPVTATVIIDWILGHGGTARYHDAPSALSIDAPGGTVNAVPGDWIARREDGTFWPWEDWDFTGTWEADTIAAEPPAVTSPAPAPAKPPATATAPSAPVSEAAVQAALDAVAPFWREAHAILQAYPSAALARAMLEGAAPLIRAAERARIRRGVLARELILQHPEDGDRVAVFTLDLEQIIGAEDGSDG